MSDVTNGIRDWMMKGGRPLEMHVAAQFSRFCHAVEQSAFYTESDSDKPREIDVVANYIYAREYSASVAIECKSKSQPFIVLLPIDEPDVLDWRCVSSKARGTLPPRRDWLLHDLYKTPLFDGTVSVGHSLLTKTTGDSQRDKGWEAAMVAVKAAHWFATRRNKGDHWHISFPVVVTDGVLATATLVDGGDIDVKEVDHARFALKWPLDSDTQVVIVDVIRSSVVPTFANGCFHAIGKLAQHAAPRA